MFFIYSLSKSSRVNIVLFIMLLSWVELTFNCVLLRINIQSLLDSEKDVHHYVSVPKLPSVERDIAVVVKKDVKAIDLVNAIKKTDKQILSDVIVFDVYEGEKIADDEKSIALKLVFTSNEPLTDEIINAKMKKVIKDLAYRFNAKLRD